MQNKHNETSVDIAKSKYWEEPFARNQALRTSSENYLFGGLEISCWRQSVSVSEVLIGFRVNAASITPTISSPLDPCNV